MKTHELHIEDIMRGLQSSGSFFSADYIKSNGDQTKIVGRFGVHKFAKGTGKSSDKVWTVWDTTRKRYTSMKPSNIVSVKFNGEIFKPLNK